MNQTGTMSGIAPSEEGQGRLCFVIMPFSKSDTCTEAEWTQIFEEVIQPAVQAASYDCRRSTVTRGNLIKGIIQDLDTSWVVLADLTDRNPNVFYELGVRHALKDRTILIAQNRDDIPFDLESYANHVYDWRTDEGKVQFAKQIKALLEDVDRDPDRADNPVSDFLESPLRREQPATVAARFDDIEKRLDSFEGGLQLLLRHGQVASEADSALSALADASPLDEGEPRASWFDAGAEIARSEDQQVLRRVVRQSVRDIRGKIPPKVLQLNSLRSVGTIQQDQISNEALKFENEFAPLARNIEQLALGLASVDWKPGARGILEVAGSLISISEGMSGVRFSVGLPAFFGWRLLLMCGARSVQEEAFGVTAVLINGPIPVDRTGGRLTYRSLVKHPDLFHPEAFLGYADLAINQIGSLYERSPHIQVVFGSKDEFVMSLIEFLILVALRDASHDEQHPLYPGYKLLPGLKNACERLISRLVTDPNQLTAVAKIFDRSGDELRETWSDLASKANSAALGPMYWHSGNIPTTLDSEE